MVRRFLLLGLGLSIIGALHAQNSTWMPLGPWELVERLDDVQITKVFRPNDLVRPTFGGWSPSDGNLGDFFPADNSWGSLLYNRLPTSGQYFAYESEEIILDDVNINPAFDTSGQGRFQMRRVELAVFFPAPGFYQIQGFWTGSDGDFPPYPTQPQPQTFNPPNVGPFSLFVPQAGVWRLATNATKDLFTVQTGRMGNEGTCPNRFNLYVGIQLSPPAAWVCGALSGLDCNMDYFTQYEPNNPDDPYVGYQLQNNTPSTFAMRVYGVPAPLQTTVQGLITINGYTGSYAGRQATVRVKRGSTVDTYTVSLSAAGDYSLQVNGTGSAEVLVQLRPGLKKKATVNLNGGTVTQNFTLTNGDVNQDNVVDDADLLQVLFEFGGNNAQADVNADGVVDDADLLIVLFNFGATGDEF